MTEPTGNSSGSAATMPLWTATPDAVSRPLQYAVALNATRAPGEGSAVVSRRIAWRAAYFESSAVTSYIDTKQPTATVGTTLFRQKDPEMIMMLDEGRIAATPQFCANPSMFMVGD